MPDNPVTQRVPQPSRQTPAMQVPRPATRLSVPIPRATSAAVRITPVNVPKLKPINLPKGMTSTKGDKGVIESILAIPGSAGSTIAKGVMALPQFAGKALTTAYYAVNPYAAAKKVIPRIAEGKKQGLSGYDLWAFANERTAPATVDIAGSVKNLGGRVLEPVTLGRFDYGQPGVDYVRAFREGNLGGVLVEDLGTVILLGRGLGAGNVVESAGTRLGGRTGAAVAGAGRLIEEPIGTTIRGAGRLTGKLTTPLAESVGPVTSRLGRMAEPATRIGEAEHPLRQMMVELGDSYKQRRANKLDAFNARIAEDRIRMEEAQRAGDIQTAEEIKFRMNQNEARAQKAMEDSGLVKTVKQAARRAIIMSERRRQTVISDAMRMSEIGVLPEDAAIYRERATRLREQAASAPTPERARQLETIAAQYEFAAVMKETYPQDFSGPIPKQLEEAAMLVHHGKALELRAEMDNMGATPAQLVRSATDPTIGPDLGPFFTPTEQGVLAAIDYVNAFEGKPHNLTPAQQYIMGALLLKMTELSNGLDAMMARGEGLPQGKLPFDMMGSYPIPRYFIEALNRFSNDTQLAVENILDGYALYLIESVIRNGGVEEFGGVDAGLWDELGIDPNEPKNVWRKLVEDGQKAVEAGENPLSYQLAYYALQMAFTELRQTFPELMLNPDIYPPTMRPMMITRRQAVRRATMEDVRGMADDMMNLARENSDVIDNNILTGIMNDVRKALDPRQAVTKQTFDRLVKRLETIRVKATARATELLRVQEGLSDLQERQLQQMDQIANTIYQLQNQLELMAEQPAPGPSPKLIRARGRVTETEAAKAAAVEESALADQELRAAEQAAEPQLAPIRAERERLLAEVETQTTKVASLTDDIDRAQEAIDQLKAALQLLETAREVAPDQPPEVTIALDLAKARDIAGDSAASRVSDAEARSARDGEVTIKQQDAYTAFGDVELLLDDKLIWDFTPEAKAQYAYDIATRRYELPTNEDYYGYLERIIPNTKTRPWLDQFIRERTVTIESPLDVGSKGLTVGEAADIAGERYLGKQLSNEEFLTELARAWVRMKEAEEAVAEAKKRPLAEWKRELADAARNEIDNAVIGDTVLGKSLSQLENGYALIDPAMRAAALDKIRELEGQRDQLVKERAMATNAARVAGGKAAEQTSRLAQLQPGREAAVRGTRARAEVARLSRQLPGQRAAVTRLRRRLPLEVQGELQQAEAQRLRPVGEVLRPAPGAEGPTVGRVKPRLIRGVQRTIEGLEKEQARRVKRINVLKKKFAAEDAVASEAQRIRGEAISREQYLAQPVGPELVVPGLEPRYLPVGPTRKMLEGRDIPLTIRGEGLGPQTKPQAIKQRISGAIPLSLEVTAARVNEVLGQLYRNSAIENILTDPEVTKSVKALIGGDRYAEIVQQAEKDADAQGVDRTTSEFEGAVQQAVGERVIKILNDMGYEPVSPVTVDPVTGAHAPVGDLTLSVTPRNIDENTFVMRRGLAQRLISEFERQGTRDIPKRLARVIEATGNGTARWKSHTLPISLRWQIGDAVSQVLFAWVRGDITPSEMADLIRQSVGRLTDPTDPRLGTVLFSDLIANPIADPVLQSGFAAGLPGRGLKVEENRFIEKFASRLTGERPEIGRLGKYDRFRAKAFRLNEAINMLGRSAVYLKNLDDLLTAKGRSLDEVNAPMTINDPEITAAITGAVDNANRILGSFSDLTPWEKQVMRQVFPFWSWIKFINKAAYELAIDNPDRVLFYSHLGSMAADPDGSDLSEWLRGKTPVAGYLFDLNFLNPYADAMIFKNNPLTATAEQFTSISPVLQFTGATAGETYYALTGRKLPMFSPDISRPGYLEGRPGATTRGLGDVLGGIGYLGLTQLGGPLRNALTLLPEGRIPFTDVATGPVQRFEQGSLRTTGAYAQPRLSPTVGRLSALGRTFGIPAPLIQQDIARAQAAEQKQRDLAAGLRRVAERRTAGA